MGTNCAPFVADLFLFCFERDFMFSLSEENNLNLLKLSILILGIWMTCWILTAWSIIFTLENLSYIRPTCQISRPHFLDLHLSISDGLIRLKFMINEMIFMLTL